MYTRKPTRSFKKSLKKIISSGNEKIEFEIARVIEGLAQDQKLDKEYRDHRLTGKLKEYRECHIKSDLLLVYRLDQDNLILVDIGSHSQIFG
jgi:mRNA interferase YafQ